MRTAVLTRSPSITAAQHTAIAVETQERGGEHAKSVRR